MSTISSSGSITIITTNTLLTRDSILPALVVAIVIVNSGSHSGSNSGSHVGNNSGHT